MPPVETLLADAGWVRRLAARLVADPDTAEDLAQETLVAAWRRPPAPGTPARPWLARVLRNFARQRARSEDARARRERHSARGADTPDDLLERAELAQRLARIVLELDEPYRTTVLRRFFDGWSAEQIARAEGTNASTVRTRLERGLSKLRERLERERGSDWMAALAPLVPLKSSAALSAGITGGIVVGTGTKIALGLCVAGLCGWIFWPRAQPIAPALEPLASEVPAQSTRVEIPAQTEPRREIASTPQASASAPKPAAVHLFPSEAAHGVIEGVVVRQRGGEEQPVAGAEVTLHEDYDPRTNSPTLELPVLASTRSATDGSFHFDRRAPGTFTLRAKTRASMREMRVVLRESAPGARVRLVFGTGRIHGTLHGENGALLEGLKVTLSGIEAVESKPHPDPNKPPLVVSIHIPYGGSLRAVHSSDELGNFSFDELPADSYYLDVRAAEGTWRNDWPGRMDRIVLVEGEDLELDAGPPDGPVYWRGVLRNAGGELVVGGGTLHLERDERSRAGSSVHTYIEARVQQDGKFDFAIEPARWKVALSLASHPEERHPCGEIDVPPGSLERDLTVPGTRVFGLVSDAGTQQPLAGYAGVLRIALHKPGESFSAAMHEAVLDDSAGYAVDTLDEGEWEVVTYPIDLSAPDKRVRFRIEKGETQHRLDLEVRKP